MSEFKYACPVCGQHIRCDSSQSGTVMDCPTCFQQITVPQAPASGSQKFIITGSKAPKSTAFAAQTAPANAPLEKVVPIKRFPGVLVVVMILLFVGTAAAAIYWATIIHPGASRHPPCRRRRKP